MPIELSTDDLVKLAEFCGHDAYVEHAGYVRTIKHDKWQPAEDAKQWNELWDMLGESGYVLELSNREDQANDPISCCHVFSTDLTVEFDITEDTRGLAVCRAALKVIEEKPNAD